MIFTKSFLVQDIVERQVLVFLRGSVGSLLVLLTIMHCLAKKLLKISALFLKSII